MLSMIGRFSFVHLSARTYQINHLLTQNQLYCAYPWASNRCTLQKLLKSVYQPLFKLPFQEQARLLSQHALYTQPSLINPNMPSLWYACIYLFNSNKSPFSKTHQLFHLISFFIFQCLDLLLYVFDSWLITVIFSH